MWHPCGPIHPATGRNRSGASVTNCAWISVSIRFPNPSFTDASVAKMCPPTLKSVAPMCEPSTAPSKLRAMRRKSAAVTTKTQSNATVCGELSRAVACSFLLDCDQPILGTVGGDAFLRPAELALGFEPVLLIVARRAAAPLPQLVGAIGNVFVIDEHQPVLIEVVDHSSHEMGRNRAAAGKLKRMPAPPSLTWIVAGPDAVASPVAGSARCRPAHWRITSLSLVASFRSVLSSRCTSEAPICTAPFSGMFPGFFIALS